MIDIVGLKDNTGDAISIEFEVLADGSILIAMQDRSGHDIKEMSMVVSIYGLVLATNEVKRMRRRMERKNEQLHPRPMEEGSKRNNQTQ